MKIGIIDIQLDPKRPGITGLSSVAWEWARHLAQMGDEVHLVGPYPHDVCGPNEVTVHAIPIPPGGYLHVLGNVLVALIATWELRNIPSLDIVHSPEYLSTAVASFFFDEQPIILTTPGNIYERIANGNPYNRTTTQVYKLAADISAQRCERIIAKSQEMMYWWQETGAEPKKLIMIPNGVNEKFYYPIPDSRRRLCLSENNTIIMYVGRLSHEKGLIYLIEAFRHVAQVFPDAELHFVGKGPLWSEIKELGEKINIGDRIKFHGWINSPKIPLYYSAADVVVLPSLSEGHPRTVLEAMACGAPFVGTKISGVEDTVLDGETGLLVPSRDAGQLSKALIEIISDRDFARSLANNGRNRILEKYTWKYVVNQMRDQVYLPVIAGE